MTLIEINGETIDIELAETLIEQDRMNFVDHIEPFINALFNQARATSPGETVEVKLL